MIVVRLCLRAFVFDRVQASRAGCRIAEISMSGDLPKTGFVRLNSILAPKGPIPVGKSTWWAGVKAGTFPKPVKLGPRVTAWRVEDIERLIRNGIEIIPDKIGNS